MIKETAKKKPLSVGTARAIRGKRTTGRLALGSYPDGTIDSPVIIASGAKPGDRHEEWLPWLIDDFLDFVFDAHGEGMVPKPPVRFAKSSGQLDRGSNVAQGVVGTRGVV